MERDARYATVALFALACIAAAFVFIWWYTDRGNARDYATYEIYFEGTVSGLSKGSPVRYLGVDVGRVTSLTVDKQDPRRVKVIADIDTSAPISGTTFAKLGLLGLTGLLYIDLQQDPRAPAGQSFRQGEQHPMISSRKGSIEASAEQLPQILGHAGAVLVRVERVLADENLRALSDTLANIESASRELPATMQDARQLSADLRRVAESTAELTARLNESFGKAQPGLEATMENARITSERLARTADSLDHLLNDNDGAFGRTATASVAELQQLVIDARSASIEVRELARTLRERPSGLLLEPQPSGVEIKQ